MFEVVRAVFPDDLKDVLDLYCEYIDSTSVDLSFQGNDQEFNQLPEKYSSEESKIFLLKKDNKPVGCAAFRKLDGVYCLSLKCPLVLGQNTYQGLFELTQ